MILEFQCKKCGMVGPYEIAEDQLKQITPEDVIRFKCVHCGGIWYGTFSALLNPILEIFKMYSNNENYKDLVERM